MTWLLVIMLGIFVLLRAEESRGGVKVQISQRGLDYAANKVLDSFLVRIRQRPIDDAEGRSGKLKYELKNIRLEEASRPDVKVTFKEDDQVISWSLSNADIEASCDWKYELRQNRFLKLKDSGGLRLKAKGLSVEVSVRLLYQETSGKPIVQTTRCESHLHDLEASFGGGSSWIYNALFGAAKNTLKRLLNDEVCRGATRVWDKDANENLSDLQLENTLSSGLISDFKLVAQPVISSNHFHILLSGCVYRPDHYDCPSYHTAMNKEVGERMVALSLSSESLNSWAEAAFLQGDLNTTILHTHLADEHNTYLDTDCKAGFCIVSFLPRIAETYPHSRLEADFITTAAPTLLITPDKLTGRITAIVKLFVRIPSDERIELFAVEVSAIMNVEARIEGNFLKLKIVDFEPSFELQSFDMEEMSETGLKWAAKVAGKVLVNKVNVRGQEGLPILKANKAGLYNSSLTFEQGYLHLSTDVSVAD